MQASVSRLIASTSLPVRVGGIKRRGEGRALSTDTGRACSRSPSRFDQQTEGHEQAGSRAGLVVSVNEFNHGPADLVWLVPLTSTVRGRIPAHVELQPPEGGVKQPSAIMCEQMLRASRARLLRRLGAVSPGTMAQVEQRIRWLAGL